MSDLRTVIDQIKGNIDLRYILPDVQIKGKDGWCRCPFHAEDTPSCHVLEQFYYCFGCGATGDYLTYLQSPAGGNFTFFDALNIAATQAGVVLGDDITKQAQKMVEEREKRQEDFAFYQSKLADNDKALKYLHEDRGLTDETIKHFGLGYRPDWDAISIPIWGKSGSLDSISFRYLDPDNKQRYYHKNNTGWSKGDCLYNAQAIHIGDGPIYCCEGMFDVMSVWQVGLTRVVGVMGGTLNDHQVKEFGDSPVVFIPDSKSDHDYEIFKKSVFRLRTQYPSLTIRVALLPEGDANSVDPDVLKSACDNAEAAELSILKHDLDRCLDVDTEYRVARKIATDITDVLTKDDIIHYLADRWKKSADVVSKALTRSDAPVSRSMTMGDALDELTTREKTASLDGVCFKSLGVERLISRPHTSQVAIIAARANVGKTVMALNMLKAGRDAMVPSLFLSMEQPASEIAFRLALMHSSEMDGMCEVNGDRLSDMIRNDNEMWTHGLKQLVEYSYPNLRLRSERFTPEGVRDAIIDASYAIGEQVKVVYIDYLGLMKSAMRSNDSYERMSAIGREMQEVTKQMDVLGIYLMQLSRKGGSGTEKVTLDMLRDSGVIEEMADYIIGAWRDSDEVEKQNADMPIRKIYVNVCKNRHGDRGTAELWMNKSTLLLSNTDYRGDAPQVERKERQYDDDGVEMPVDPWE